MPKDAKKKDKKWSKHVDKDFGYGRMEELEEKAARLGVEVWQLKDQSDEESEENEEIKEAAREESGEEEEEDSVAKGHQGLINIKNPNRLKPLTKSDFRTPEEMADSKKALKQKANNQVTDLQRLQEVRARREAAAKQREEEKSKRENLKEEAKKGIKKKN